MDEYVPDSSENEEVSSLSFCSYGGCFTIRLLIDELELEKSWYEIQKIDSQLTFCQWQQYFCYSKIVLADWESGLPHPIFRRHQLFQASFLPFLKLFLLLFFNSVYYVYIMITCQ